MKRKPAYTKADKVVTKIRQDVAKKEPFLTKMEVIAELARMIEVYTAKSKALNDKFNREDHERPYFLGMAVATHKAQLLVERIQ